MKDYLRIFCVAIAMIALSLIEIFRPDVIQQVDRILSRFAAWP